jgi:hypothetical protein
MLALNDSSVTCYDVMHVVLNSNKRSLMTLRRDLGIVLYVGVPTCPLTHNPTGDSLPPTASYGTQALRPGAYPRPSNRVLGRVLGTLKYPDTYSSNVELSTLVPGTYSSAPSDHTYLPTWYHLPEYLSRNLLTTRYLLDDPTVTGS